MMPYISLLIFPTRNWVSLSSTITGHCGVASLRWFLGRVKLLGKSH
jgi:hypothetical protein